MSEYSVFSTVTIYDVFLGIAGQSSTTLDKLKQSMWLRDDSNMPQCIEELLRANLISQKGDIYTTSSNSSSEALLSLLALSLSIDIDYNFYMQEDMRYLVSSVYGKQIFSLKDIGKLDKDTARKLIKRLCDDKLAISFIYSPFTGRLINNHLLNLYCSYWKIKPQKATGFFERKIKLTSIIEKHIFSRQNGDKQNIMEGCRFFYSSEQTPPSHSQLTKLQHLLKYEVIPKRPEIFDNSQSQNNVKALKFLENIIDQRHPLTKKLIDTYHSLLMFGNDTPEPYRNFEVKISNNSKFKPCPHSKIDEAMNSFIDNYKNRFSKANSLSKALELAAYTYSELIYIQPYPDGNSRTSLLVMKHVLRQLNTGLDTIPPFYDFRFIMLTKGAPKRNDEAVVELLQELLLLNINKLELDEMVQYI